MKPSRNGIADACAAFVTTTRLQAWGGGLKKGRNEIVSAFFDSRAQFNTQAVTGRLRCLTVIPAFPIFNVIPAPE